MIKIEIFRFSFLKGLYEIHIPACAVDTLVSSSELGNFLDRFADDNEAKIDYLIVDEFKTFDELMDHIVENNRDEFDIKDCDLEDLLSACADRDYLNSIHINAMRDYVYRKQL